MSTSTTLSLPFSRPLPARYRIRHVTTADRTACLRLISHSFMFHNAIDTPWHEPVDNYQPLAALFFDHAMADTTHNHSFVITDTHSAHPPHPPAHDDSSEHEADLLRLSNSTDIVGVVICYDASRVADMDTLRTHPSFSRSQVSHDLYVLLDSLYQHDLRADPAHPLHHYYQPTLPGGQPAAPAAGNTIECFLLATNCQYSGERLASYMCGAVYQLGQQCGYRALETVATHPATAHIFMQLGGGKSVVTHRIRPSELWVKRMDGASSTGSSSNGGSSSDSGSSGSEWQPWVDVKDDMVAIHVPIVPAEQISGSE